MKLEQWFEEQAAQQPSSLQKMRMYQRVLDQTHRSISYHKVSYYARVALFSLGLLVIAGTAFYSFIPQGGTPYQIAKINDAYMTLDQRDGQFAQADTIGNIISTHGGIQIIHGSREIETSTLGENDRVLLAAGAEMHFRVDTNVEAKITGPAEFVLEDRGLVDGVQQYVINLLAGDYLEIVTIPTPAVENVEETTIISPIANVIVQAPEFTLEQVDTHGALDVVISKTEDGKSQIENKGTEVVVKKIVEDKQTFVAVQANEKVAINGHVEFVAAEVDELLQDIEEQQLTVTYQIEDGIDTGKDINDILVTSTTIRKTILDEETMDAFHATINATFLAHDIAQMQQYYTAGNQASFLIAYGNVLAKLQRAHILLDVTYTPLAADITTLSTAAKTIQTFAATITSLYYIEPASLNVLVLLASSLNDLAQQSFGGVEVVADDLVNEDTIIIESEGATGEHEAAPEGVQSGDEDIVGEEMLVEETISDVSYEALLEGLDIE